MTSRKSRARLCSWLLLVGAACFAESPSTSGDTGTACPVGTNGCPCDGGQCEASLVCHGPSSNCYEPQCTLGSLACPCVDGQCLGGLSCVDDFCEAMSGTDGTTMGSMSMGSMSTGDEMTSLPPPVTEGTSLITEVTSLTDATTTLFPTDTSDVITDDTQTLTGTDNGCAECLMDAPKQCTCSNCVELAQCYYDSGMVGECCAMYPDQADDWNEYVTCNTLRDCGLSCVPPPVC